MDAQSILLNDDFVVPPVRPAAEGVAWLRSHVARFSEGDDHRRRRAIVEGLLAPVEPEALARSGDHLATLAEALGLPRTAAREVRAIAPSYQPHTEVTSEADTAVTRLVTACGGRWDEHTANLIGLLVQACDATAGLVAGHVIPVPTTRRIGPDGQQVHVELTDLPFGAGRHECPGRRHAVALAEGASRFHRLHEGPEPLMLPNAWDMASATLFAQEGFHAVGTTSLGIAAAAGVPDASGLARNATMTVAGNLVRLPVPITVDIESGWGADLVNLAAELAEIGVAGVNIEDGRVAALAAPGEQEVMIKALKRGSPNLFVNARVDTYWLASEIETTIERARRYVDAGADGIFVPALTDDAAITALVAAVDAPVNVLACADPRRLGELGVRRISTGSSLFRSALTAARSTAIAARQGPVPDRVLPYDQVNDLAGLFR
jgi:2-methylisocitrate lyase-like PEP mutase family enzyme